MATIYIATSRDDIRFNLKEVLVQRYDISFIYKDKMDIDTDDISNDSLLIYDFTDTDDSWDTNWPDNMPTPKRLNVKNIAVLGIVKREHHDLALSLLENGFSDYIPYPFEVPAVLGPVMNTLRDIELDKELNSLYQIGIDLSAQIDLDTLLNDILRYAQDFTSSDGGSIYLVTDEKDQSGNRLMTFEQSRSDTLGDRYHKLKMPITDRSIAGHCIISGDILNIEDVYSLPPNVPYKFDNSFDKANNYRCLTMLTVPMINHKREVIGALQLINRKKNRKTILSNPEKIPDEILEFDHKCERLIKSLAGQATIAVENSQLYEELRILFESFMAASVSAVESRDPSTAGHSRRVSKLSVAIAHHISIRDNEPFKDINFDVNDIQAIKYAGLLHDFGKIGINEKILLKAKKLFDEELTKIDARMELLKYTFITCDGNTHPIDSIISKVGIYSEAIRKANEPGRIEDNTLTDIKEAHTQQVKKVGGEHEPAISEYEFNRLINSRGSLSSDEYKIIQSHVEHTHNFLSLISWPKGYESVDAIARFHHEKLDGTGYPLGLKGNQIPIGSQIMCIADIFDALISSDRPYKTRMPIEKALAILEEEANAGKINKDILELMIDNELYKIILE